MDTQDPVERLQQGDKAAFREIVEGYQARVRGLIACMGLRAADVDDVAQDTFIHIYEHIREFTAGTNFPAWVRTIARFKALAFLEAARREAENRGKALEAFLIAGETGAETETEPLLERLMSCMERMGDAARDLLEKRYSGAPLGELARQSGHSEDAMKMQLFRIRVALKRCVEARS